MWCTVVEAGVFTVFGITAFAYDFKEAACPVEEYGSLTVTKVAYGGGGCGSKAACWSEDAEEVPELVICEVEAVPGNGDRPSE